MCLKLLALFLKPGKEDRYICLINFWCADVVVLIQLLLYLEEKLLYFHSTMRNNAATGVKISFYFILYCDV